MNSNRTLKRLEQMQRRKDSLFETDSLKLNKNLFESENNITKQIFLSIKNLSGNILDKHFYSTSDNHNYNLLSFDKLNDNEIKEEESEKNNDDKISELDFDINYDNVNNGINNKIINNEEIENDDVEVNISDLDCEIDCENNNNEETEIDTSSNEYAKNFLCSNSKSFIPFNNNLIARAAAQKEKNTPSYIFALCPELFNKDKNLNNKDIISENYAVKDAIKEENENEIIKPIKIINQCQNKNQSIDLSDFFSCPNIRLCKRKKGKKSNSEFFFNSNDLRYFLHNSKIENSHFKTLSNISKISNNSNAHLKLLSFSSKGYHSRQISLMNPIVEYRNRDKKKGITSKYYHKFRKKLGLISNSNSNLSSVSSVIHHMKSKTSYFSPLVKIA